MSQFVLRSARVAVPTGILEDAWVAIDGPKVSATGQGAPPIALGAVLDLGDVLIAPGFIDLHVHGGGGAEVNCATTAEVEEAVRHMARFHAAHGTTALVATTVSDEPRALQAAVEGVAAVALATGPGSADGQVPNGNAGYHPLGATVLGSHLEGPWIAPSKAGAQFPAALRRPSVGELADLLGRGRGTVRLVTIAPELDGALDLIATGRAGGAVIAIGHTDADYETTVAAFDAGARHATHLFNAMAPIHHREPGPVAAALADGRVTLEIIADGVHIHPALISLVATLAPDRLVLVTDAIAATGTPPGRHRLGPLEVVVSNGRAVLAGQEETVAGSVLTMDKALALAVQEAGVPLLTALRAASLHPANALGERAKGRLSAGADADVVILDNQLGLVATLIGGQVAHDPKGALGAAPPGALAPQRAAQE